MDKVKVGVIGCGRISRIYSIFESSRTEHHVAMTTRCERPAPLPLGLQDGELDG